MCQICVKRAAKTTQIDTKLHGRVPEKLFKNNKLTFRVGFYEPSCLEFESLRYQVLPMCQVAQIKSKSYGVPI